ncbi:MAG: ABC transporter ATP-binding protein [Armatimonadota bacterium]|nr:ABC transporter ATP-binding protein [Armatimonadota bacterium]MDR7535564.1 ABC transporter ATP-binding protein [Armatimonadota bacterium]
MLEVSGLEVRYGDLQALWGVSLRVAPGEIVALLGHNGAGKTTLLRTIAGLLRPAAGVVTFDGRPLHREPAHRTVERGIALVPEGRRLFAGMTVEENLLLGGFAPAVRARRQETLREVLEIFPALAERRHQVAGTLSGGEQQMVAIGRALMARPRLLLLDEPSLGLAPLVVRRMFEVVREINAARGVTVLLVEQNVKGALHLASRVYLMQAGRIVGEGTPAALARDEQVRRAFLDVGAGTA